MAKMPMGYDDASYVPISKTADITINASTPAKTWGQTAYSLLGLIDFAKLTPYTYFKKGGQVFRISQYTSTYCVFENIVVTSSGSTVITVRCRDSYNGAWQGSTDISSNNVDEDIYVYY